MIPCGFYTPFNDYQARITNLNETKKLIKTLDFGSILRFLRKKSRYSANGDQDISPGMFVKDVPGWFLRGGRWMAGMAGSCKRCTAFDPLEMKKIVSRKAAKNAKGKQK